jgi:hypothetical protein
VRYHFPLVTVSAAFLAATLLAGSFTMPNNNNDFVTDVVLPSGLRLVYTNPPPHATVVPKPYLEVTSDDQAHRVLFGCLFHTSTCDLEEMDEEVTRGLNGEPPPPGARYTTTGFSGISFQNKRCFVRDYKDNEFEIPLDLFEAVYRVWYPAMIKYRADQIAKFGKADW